MSPCSTIPRLAEYHAATAPLRCAVQVTGLAALAPADSKKEMGMKPTGLLALTCVAALTVACNGNGRTSTDQTTDKSTTVGTTGEKYDTSLKSSDRSFVDDLTYAGNAEVELGRVAAMRAASPAVKKFGQMMVDDHTKAGKELAEIASMYNVTQPSGLDEKHRDLENRLAKMNGPDFDKAYMDAMIDGHQNVVDTLESRVDEVNRSATLTGKQEKDTNVKPETSENSITASLNAFAANALPVVKGHLDQAKAIKDQLTQAEHNTTARR
jgi:putative membrane protein